MGFEVIAAQIAMLGIAMLIGFGSVKLKYLEKEIAGSVSRVIVRITLPLLIITSITSQDLNADMLKNAGILIVIAAAAQLLLFGAATLTAKCFGLCGATKTIHRLMGTFGNVIFLGYPLITALYGQTGLFYAVIYALVNDGFVWTYGVYLMVRDKEGQSEGSPLRNLINPNTVSFAISIIMLAFGLRLPELIHTTFAGIGSLTTYLSMLFIGMTLATIDLKTIYKKVSIFVLTAVKMVLFPLCLILVLRLLPLDRTLCGVIVLQVAMPVQTVLTILAREYESDFKYAAECVFITTVLSLGLLPLCYYMILLLF